MDANGQLHDLAASVWAIRMHELYSTGHTVKAYGSVGEGLEAPRIFNFGPRLGWSGMNLKLRAFYYRPVRVIIFC
jgi:hypothetical protein